MSEIYEFDHRSPSELAALIRPQMIGTEENALDALTALQHQAEFPRYDALRAALRDAQAEVDALRAALRLALMHLEDPLAISAVRAAIPGESG